MKSVQDHREELLAELELVRTANVELPDGQVVCEDYRFGDCVYDVIKRLLDQHPHLNVHWHFAELCDPHLELIETIEQLESLQDQTLYLIAFPDTECMEAGICESVKDKLDTAVEVVFITKQRTRVFNLNPSFTVKYYQRLLELVWFDMSQVQVWVCEHKFLLADEKIKSAVTPGAEVKVAFTNAERLLQLELAQSWLL